MQDASMQSPAFSKRIEIIIFASPTLAGFIIQNIIEQSNLVQIVIFYGTSSGMIKIWLIFSLTLRGVTFR